MRTSVTDVREHLLAEQADLVMATVAPELEHHVRAPRLAVLLDCGNAVLGSSRDRLAAVEQGVGDLGLGGEPATTLHRVGYGRELLHLDPGKLEERVGRPADVLELVREIHAGDLARAVTALVA